MPTFPYGWWNHSGLVMLFLLMWEMAYTDP